MLSHGFTVLCAMDEFFELFAHFIKDKVVFSFVNPSKRIQAIKQEIETKKACCDRLKANHPNLTPAQMSQIKELEEEIG